MLERLGALDTRLHGLETKVDIGFAAVDAKFKSLESRMAIGFTALEKGLEAVMAVAQSNREGD